jgi:hypothetical protein
VSVEAMVISALVEEGSPKRAFQAGISEHDFEVHDEEWLGSFVVQSKRSRSTFGISSRTFPEFDFIRSRENIGDLLDELKSERAYVAISSAIEEIYGGESPIDQDNAVEKAMELREILGDVLKLHAPHSDVLIKSDWETHYKNVRELMILRETGHATWNSNGHHSLRSSLGRAYRARQERLCSDGQVMRRASRWRSSRRGCVGRIPNGILLTGNDNASAQLPIPYAAVSQARNSTSTRLARCIQESCAERWRWFQLEDRTSGSWSTWTADDG